MPQKIINLLEKVAEANKTDKFRDNNVVCLPAEGSVVVSGDIHGHTRNFERIIAFSDLANNPDRHLVLQEIIHGGPKDSEGNCLSYKLLLDAIDYKLSFPNRVHFVMGNHDVAFISNTKVMKDGREMNFSMRQALDSEFEQAGADIKSAISQFLLSQPLAVRCENRIWVSHSLPSQRQADKFDRQILDRAVTAEDCKKPGSVYLLTWGRRHSQELLDKMAKLFDVDIFILGHQTQSQGWSSNSDNLIIITSEHNHGCLLTIDLAESYTTEKLIKCIVPLASIA